MRTLPCPMPSNNRNLPRIELSDFKLYLREEGKNIPDKTQGFKRFAMSEPRVIRKNYASFSSAKWKLWKRTRGKEEGLLTPLTGPPTLEMK